MSFHFAVSISLAGFTALQYIAAKVILVVKLNLLLVLGQVKSPEI